MHDPATLRAFILALAELMKTVVALIELKGAQGMPSGHLYAELMGLPGMTYNVYMDLIEKLKGWGYIEQRGQVLYRTTKELGT